MIVNKYANGGGGSSSGVTPQEVQQQIDSALTPYWNSGETVDYVDEALSGISLDGYYTSAQTDEKIASAVTPVSEHLYEVEQITASAYTELHDGLLEVSARTVDMSGYYTSAQTEEAIAEALSGFTPAGNSNILAAISSLTEYEAISGSVKTGDLIQVWGVDINGDGDPDNGLFRASVNEGETRRVFWDRVDNGESLVWSDKYYPWMAENGVLPVEIGRDTFIIADTDPDAYNGIGFDGDGKPVITHIVPQYEEGEVTGMTREDTPIGGSLPVGYETVEHYTLSNCAVVTLDGKVFGEDLYDIPRMTWIRDGYNDPDRGYVMGVGYAFGYYDEDENFVPVFLPAGTYAFIYEDNGEDTNKVIRLFHGKVNGEEKIYIDEAEASVVMTEGYSVVSPLFTIAESVCPTSDDGYRELYLDYTDKPSAQSQIDTLDEVVSAALVDLNEKKVESDDIKHIVKLTQAEYDQLATKDPETFYIIVNSI